MALPVRSSQDPDGRCGPGRDHRLLVAVKRSLAESSAPGGGSSPSIVVARSARGERCLELVCAGETGFDVVAALAPIVARFGAELIVRSVPDTDDPAVAAAVRQGGVVVWGSLDPTPRPGLVHAAV